MSTEILRRRVGMVNIYVLRDRGIVVVDPGGPPGGRAGANAVLPLLGSPLRLDLIVLTHAHCDHFAAADRLRAATGAPIAVHRADAPWLRTGRVVWPPGVTRWGRFVRTTFDPLARVLSVPVFEPDLLLGDEGLDLEPYGVAGRVVHTPGHSPGSLSVLLPSGDAIVGDLMMNSRLLCRRPSFGVFAQQPALVPSSWRHLLELGVQTVHPAHGRPFAASAFPGRR